MTEGQGDGLAWGRGDRGGGNGRMVNKRTNGTMDGQTDRQAGRQTDRRETFHITLLFTAQLYLLQLSGCISCCIF